MSAPPRMFENGTALESALLRAGRSERPSRDGRKRAILAATAAATATTAVVGAKSGLVAGLKLPAWLAAIGIGLASVSVAVVVLSKPTTSPAIVTPPAPSMPSAVIEARVPPAVAPIASESAPVTSARPLKAVRTPPAKIASPPPSATPAAAPIEDELTLLRRAKARVAANDGEGALAFLDLHARSHPDGALTEEAAALRVEALAMAGDTARARRAADSFFDRYPSSPYAQRVRSAAISRASSEPR